MSESQVIFERESPSEPALIIHVGNLDKLDHPEIQKMIPKLGISKEWFEKLLRQDFDKPAEPTRFPVNRPNGKKMEDIEQYIVNTPWGNVEVSDCNLYPPAVSGKDDTGFHLRGGFEIIYALKGEATLFFPKSVTPVSPVEEGLYITSSDRDHVKMQAGDLAIIPAPTANGWSAVGEGFRFRYICLPPWNPQFVRKTLDE